MAGVGEEGAEAARGSEAVHADLLPPSLPPPPSCASLLPSRPGAAFRPDLGLALPPRTAPRVPPAHVLMDTTHPQPGKLAHPWAQEEKEQQASIFFYFFILNWVKRKTEF